MKKIILIAFSAFTLVLAFQNCGDVKVAEQVQQSTTTSLLSGEFCAGTPGSDIMQVQNFFFVNLTTKTVGKKLLADSDIDGVPDEIEKANAQLGFSSTNAYSSGILDGICFQQGGRNCVPTVCDQTILSLGLLRCDAAAISSSTALTGVDTDLDGVPDFIEVLKGLDPIRAIADEDNDMLPNGVKSNIDEIQKGLDPISQDDVDDSQQIHVTAPKLSNKGVCGNQDHYSFSVSSFPLLDVQASTNPKFPELSHAANENVMMAFYISHPLDRTKKAKIFYQILKVNKTSGPPTLSMDPLKFKLLGNFDAP